MLRFDLWVAVYLVFISQNAAADQDYVSITLKFKPDLENGERVYETCATCHLPDGWGNQDGTYPQLAGQHQNVLIQQLLKIRSGDRDNPQMHPFVQQRTLGGYQNMADVVAYISTLKMTPDNNRGPWKPATSEYKKGEKLYRANCTGCHGEKGEGSDAMAYPRLQGQHYSYLIRQAKMVSRGLRKVDPVMLDAVKKLDHHDLELIINYVSYLPVDPQDIYVKEQSN